MLTQGCGEQGRKNANDISLAVAMPNYNSSKYLQQALRSLPLEEFNHLVFVDDCSYDGSFEIASNNLKDLGIRHTCIRNESNLGATSNIGKTLSLAKCKADIAMLFPSDDVMKIRNFDSLKLMYQKDSNLAMTNQIQVYMNEYGHALKTVFIPPDTKLMSVFALPILFSQNFLAAPGSTFRSSVFKQEYLGSNTSQIQDWCLGIQLRIRGNIRTGTCGYMLYRQHPGAISSKANYLQTHIEWYNFMREFIQHDLPLYTNSLSEFKKRIFCHFTKFYSRDKPNCSHKIELLLLIAKVCDQKDSQIQRVSFEECLKYQFIQRIYKVKKSSKILERIVYMIVMKDFVSLNKILIMMSTYFFLMKRTIRCLLS